MDLESEVKKILDREINDYNHLFKKEDDEVHPKNDNLLNCKICNKKFSNKSNLIKHKNRIHNNLGFKCGYEGCDKWYSDKHYLKVHITKKHMEERVYKCKYCDRGYTYKLTYMAHLREAHLNVYPYLCIVKGCLSAFSIKRKMINHIRNFHKGLVTEVIKLINENKNINK
jgi:uncharacterized Zn-finger protein